MTNNPGMCILELIIVEISTPEINKHSWNRLTLVCSSVILYKKMREIKFSSSDAIGLIFTEIYSSFVY